MTTTTPLAADSHALELRYQRACALQALGDEAQTNQAYIELLRDAPTHLGALVNFGRHLVARGNRTAARTLFEQAVACHPQDAVSRIHLGSLLFEASDTTTKRGRVEGNLRISRVDVGEFGLQSCSGRRHLRAV